MATFFDIQEKSMPLPTPKADEAEADFVSRFMGNPQAINDFPDESQRAAVAYRTYRDEEEMDELELAGVSILEVGEAKGHDLFVDKESLETALELMQEAKNGVKVKMNHGSGLDAVVGFARNPRIENDKLVADLRLLRNSPHFGLIKEMASEAPDQFGVSLAFVNESEEIDGKKFIRPQSIASADLVSSPAATNGLFEEMLAFAMKNFADRCWPGYKPAKGVKPFEPGSCVRAEEKNKPVGDNLPDLNLTKEKREMENTDLKKDMDEIKVRLAALEEAMKPKDEDDNEEDKKLGKHDKEESKDEKSGEVVNANRHYGDKKKDEEMSEVIKKVLTEFGIKPIAASPVAEEAPAKKEEPKNFEELVAAHADYGTSKLKAMKAVMLSNPKEYAEALSRGINKI
jgi:hypothetical protein